MFVWCVAYVALYVFLLVLLDVIMEFVCLDYSSAVDCYKTALELKNGKH